MVDKGWLVGLCVIPIAGCLCWESFTCAIYNNLWCIHSSMETGMQENRNKSQTMTNMTERFKRTLEGRATTIKNDVLNAVK